MVQRYLQDDELKEFLYDDLVEMLNDAGELVVKEKAKLKDLELKFGSLQVSYEELKTPHENLKKTLLAYENKAKCGG